MNDPGQPHEHLAAVMLASRTLQRLLSEGYGYTEEQMSEIRSAALELADSLHIKINFKSPKKEGK